MKSSPILRAALLLPLVCIGLLVACDDGANPVTEVEEPDDLVMAESPRMLLKLDPLTVMSRNIYLGGDIGAVLAVGFGDMAALAGAAQGVWDEVQGNDFNERVVALVDEIQEKRPDIVGIQELAQFVVLDFLLDPPNPTVVGFVDFKEILEGELGKRGLPYSFVETVENTVVQAPIAGFGEGEGFVPTRVIQLTIRDGVLARDGFKIDGVSKGNYTATVPLVDENDNPILELKRGWIKVDAEYKGVPHHFITTHLEIQSFSPVQVGQTQELLGQVAAGLDGVTVLLGDFNSDATAQSGDPSWTPSYDMITKAGFGDAWQRTFWRRRAPGLTCCHLSDLSNTTSVFNQRIDFIFVRTVGLRRPILRYPGLMALDVIGDEPQDRTGPNQLWPSDHAGVVADFYGSPTWFRLLR